MTKYRLRVRHFSFCRYLEIFFNSLKNNIEYMNIAINIL